MITPSGQYLSDELQEVEIEAPRVLSSLAVLLLVISHTIAAPYFEKRQAASPGVGFDRIDLTLFQNLSQTET